MWHRGLLALVGAGLTSGCAGILALAISVSVSSEATADQIAGSRISSASWAGAAYAWDGTNKFSHCAISAQYRSGITMLFSVSSDYTWRVGWAHQSWNFTKGQTVSLDLFIDGIGPYNLVATATNAGHLALAELPAKAALFDLVRRGYRMTVNAVGNKYEFNLDGTYGALAEVLQCVGQHIQSTTTATSRPPNAPMVDTPKPSATSEQVSAEQKLEATKVVANVLAQGDMTGFRLLTAKETTELKSDYINRSDVAWRADGIVGTLRILTTKVSLAAANAQLIGDDAKGCKGKFASGSTADEKSADVLRVFTACEEDGKSYEIRYTLVPVPDGTQYLFATIGVVDKTGTSGKVAKVETILRQAVFEVMKH
jgi:hypothetical protein